MRTCLLTAMLSLLAATISLTATTVRIVNLSEMVQASKDPRQEHASGSRRLHVGIREPGVEGKEGDLDRKGEEEGDKEPALRLKGEREIQECDQVKGRRPASELRV